MSKRLRSLILRARLLIEEADNFVEEYPLAYEIYVFDFDQTLQHKYKPLPCVDLMRDLMAADVPCYIVTAREPNKGQEEHICDVLKRWDIKLPVANVYAIGNDVEKGPYVLDLIKRHEAEKCTFYDDKDYNCESVFESCAQGVDELHVYHLSLIHI